LSETQHSDHEYEMQRVNLEGKIALLTGASKGIGEAMAWALAAAGAKVAVSSRNQEAVDKVADAMKAEGYDAMGIAAKMGTPEAADHLLEALKTTWGGVDVIVNNAATNPVYGPIVDTPLTAFDKIFGVNVRAPFELCQKAHPIMAARGGGSIINVASVAGVSPWQGIGIYSVSKTALIGLTKVMAKEWGAAGIRVNAICPGLIQTKFSQALWRDEATMAKFKENLALPRLGQPKDLMGLAVFLASDLSLYCSGGIFTADGGLTI